MLLVKKVQQHQLFWLSTNLRRLFPPLLYPMSLYQTVVMPVSVFTVLPSETVMTSTSCTLLPLSNAIAIKPDSETFTEILECRNVSTKDSYPCQVGSKNKRKTMNTHVRVLVTQFNCFVRILKLQRELKNQHLLSNFSVQNHHQLSQFCPKNRQQLLLLGKNWPHLLLFYQLTVTNQYRCWKFPLKNQHALLQVIVRGLLRNP